MPPQPQPRPPLTPGLYDALHTDVRPIFGDFFEGAKFSFSRPVGDYLQVMHSWMLGSNSSYHFNPTFLGPTRPFAGEAYPLVTADLGSDGNMFTKMIAQINDGTKLTMQGQVQEKKWAYTHFEVEHHGKDYAADVKLVNVDPVNNSGIYIVNYLQQLTERISLGGEFTYHKSAMGEMSNIQLGGRYKAGSGLWSTSVTASLMGLQTTYTQTMANQRAAVAADLNIDLRQGTAESVLGVLYNFQKANFRAQIATSGQVTAVLEHMIAPMISLVLTGSINHWTHECRFGFGLTLQGG